MEFARMIDKDHEPSEAEIQATIGGSSLWAELREYIDSNYDFIPELIYYGKKYGWTLRYRKVGKTLVSLFPEHGAFTALIVLGKKEGDKVAGILGELSASIRELIGSTKQLHDGKWLWIRVSEHQHAEDVRRLLSVKRRPSAKSQ